MKLFASIVLLGCLSLVEAGNNDAEEARWVVDQNKWGYVSYITEGDPKAFMMSYGDHEGRIFFYLMGEQRIDASLVLSEAAIDPNQYEGAKCGEKANLDPEDPRCAKLTLSGTVAPCDSDLSCQVGKEALFAKHPQMKSWPTNHNFHVHEMTLEKLWMIANYGGGSNLSVKDFQSVSPKHHPGGFPPVQNLRGTNNHYDENIRGEIPPWNDTATRARWLVAHSLWTSVTTISVHLEGKAWGNVRSVVDGISAEEANGLPVFYLPTPDPTGIDVEQNPKVTLSFTEAALAERVQEGAPCGGLDPMDPTCGQIHLSGTVRTLTRKEMAAAMNAFKARHPFAPWLANGGAHTGGSYFTIELESIVFLDYYGGPTPLSTEDYLGYEKAQLPSAVN